VAGASCKDFENSIFAIYGATAEAEDSIDAADSTSVPDNAPSLVIQDVAQFASSGAAWTFFKQAQAKYNQCPSISFTSNDATLGQITETVTNQNISSTTVGGHNAFQVDQSDEVMIQQDGISDAESLNTTFVVAGDNVYEIQWLTVSDVHVPNWMLNTLIGNVQKLYH